MSSISPIETKPYGARIEALGCDYLDAPVSGWAGQTAKVANHMNVAMTIEAAGEALLFAAKAGADPARVRQALMSGIASSKVLEGHGHGDRMIKRTFDPGFRIALHQKDLNFALTAARQLGLSLPNTATCQELFDSCAARQGSG